MTDLRELDKLEQYLKDNGITYERKDYEKSKILNWHQISVPSEEDRLWDAVCHFGSYGHEKGLLEIMGTIVDIVRVGDEVEGYLTADDVIERIKQYEQKS